MSESWEPYRVICDAEALREAFCDRVEDLNVSRIGLDEAGDFTPGYAAKLLCDPPMRRIATDSLDKMLRATGTVLVMVVDDARFAEVKAGLMARKHRVRRVGRIIRIRGYFTKENAGKYSKQRWENVTPEMRKKFMRRIAKAGWRTRRARAKLSQSPLVAAQLAAQ